MSVSQVTVNASFSFLSGSSENGKNDGMAEVFAGLVGKFDGREELSPRQKQLLMERARIAEVGVIQFQREQHDLKKMMRLLAYFRDHAKPDEQAALGGLIRSLEDDPPLHPQQMCARIEAFLDNLPAGGEDSLKQRLKDIYRQIKEWMERPEEELGRLAGVRGNGL
jgi:hypothetical protein